MVDAYSPPHGQDSCIPSFPIVGIQLLPDLTNMHNSAKPVILSKLSERVKLGDPPLGGVGK